MKKIILLNPIFKASVLLCLMYQSNNVMAGAISMCMSANSATGYSSGIMPTHGCTDPTGIGLYENYFNNFKGNTASIGVGIDNNGKDVGGVYIYAPNGTTINSTLSMVNHKITGVADGTANSDAVNLGQLEDAKADAIAQSNTYTDTAKADAIAQSNAYTDTAKADAIAQSNIYTNTQIGIVNQTIADLSDSVVHYDRNVDGTVNKGAVTLGGGASGTKLTNVTDGQIHSNSKDAINGSQLNTTNQAMTEYLGGGATYNNITQSFNAPTYQIGSNYYHNVGDALAALNQEDILLNQRINDTNKRVDSLENQLNKGLAMAAAINGLFQPYNVGKFNVSVAAGGHNSHHALAVGSGYRFNESVAVKSGLAFTQGQSSILYNVGVNFEW